MLSKYDIDSVSQVVITALIKSRVTPKIPLKRADTLIGCYGNINSL